MLFTRKNVLFAEIFDDATIGGSHIAMFNVVSGLDKKKYNIFINFPDFSNIINEYSIIDIPFTILKKQIVSKIRISLIRKAINWYRLIYKKKNEIKRILKFQKIDLLIVNNTLYTSSPYINAARQLNIPVIVFERGNNFYSKAELKNINYISNFLAVSKAVKLNMVERGIPESKIQVFYDGIDFPKIINTTPDKEFRKKYKIPENAKIIGIVGNVKSWKGQDIFVKALINLCKRDNSIYGVIIGGWNDRDYSYKMELEQKISNKNLSKRILFLGFQDKVLSILKELSVFVHASTRPEPFGIVLLEAMASRIPIIATNMGGPKEILDGGICGILIPPNNVDILQKSILEYLYNSNITLEKVNFAFAKVKNSFSLKSSIKKIELIIDNHVK